MPALTTFAIHGLLDLTLNSSPFTTPAGQWLTVHTTPPSTDSTGLEPVGGGYARQTISFDPAADGATASDVAVTWSPLHTTDDLVIVGWSIWDDPTAGNMLAYHGLPSALLVRANKALSFAVGAISIGSVGTAITDWLANQWLDHLLSSVAYTPTGTNHLGQFTVTPARDDPGVEVVDGSYARQPATDWSLADTRQSTTTVDVTWSPLAAADQNLAGWELLDDVTAGNGLFFGDWLGSTTVDITGGDDAIAGAGAITIRVG